MTSENTCPLCERELGDENIDRHHLVPKSKGGKVQELIHKICHRKLHATLTEKELAINYHTWASLKAHPEILKFIAWVKKQPLGFYSGSDETSDRKRKRRR